jgi:hypothetical protein
VGRGSARGLILGLKPGESAGKSAKQAEIGLADLRKIVSIALRDRPAAANGRLALISGKNG